MYSTNFSRQYHWKSATTHIHWPRGHAEQLSLYLSAYINVYKG